MNANITSDLSRLAERQANGGFTPAVATKREQIAAILVTDEGARPDEAEFVAGELLHRLRWPADGGSAIVLGQDGQPAPDMSVADLIGRMRKNYPFCFAGGPVPPVGSPSSSQTHTARALAADAARKAGQAKADDVNANPYRVATRNLTRQAVIERNDPAKAARLRAEAGLR